MAKSLEDEAERAWQLVSAAGDEQIDVGCVWGLGKAVARIDTLGPF